MRRGRFGQTADGMGDGDGTIVAGHHVLDLHGKNAYQARIAVDVALRRADRGVYRLRVIHGHNRGTVLRDLLSTYAAHEKVLRVAQYNAGTTDLILREM